jgi:hypothetical protein
MTHLSIEHAARRHGRPSAGDTTTAADQGSSERNSGRSSGPTSAKSSLDLPPSWRRPRAAGLALEHATEFSDDTGCRSQLTRLPSGTTFNEDLPWKWPLRGR